MPIFQQPYAERRQLMRATLLLTLLTLALAGLLLASCHRTKPSAPAQMPPVTIDTLRSRLAAEQYQRIQTADSAGKHARPTVTDYENALKHYDANRLVLP